ncbi:MAG: tRNA (adenosine(37)-N6)-dimethylallyltransferase MiaA [Planctomycetota bacterium]
MTLIFGCTGSGKGSLAFELAQRTGGEIISIDSMKVYRRMDIGTAKPSREVRRCVRHHLIDVVEPSEEFSVAEYVRLAQDAIADIQARGRPIFVVGGTPLYIKALSEGLFEGPGANPEIRARLVDSAKTNGHDLLYDQLRRVDPVAAERIHPNDLRRIVRALEVHELTGQPISSLQRQWDQTQRCYNCLFFGLRRTREDQGQRTNERVRRMMADGFVDEVRSLLNEPLPMSTAAGQALGYAEIIRHLQGELSLTETVELIKVNTRRFAKAQRTWFRRFRETEWIDVSSESSASQLADDLLHRRESLWSLLPK